MKKIKLFSALALTLVMASCDDFNLPNPPGQTNTDPEAFFADADLELAPQSEAISLTEANAANQYVTVANITTLNNFPTDYELVINMEVGSNTNFSKTTTVETVINGDAVTVNPDLLNGAIQNVVTKEPGTYDVNARFAAYAVKKDTRIRLGGLDKYYLTEVVNIKTYDPSKVIETSYYLIPCNADGTPNMASALVMENTSGEGASQYDNPEFAVKVQSEESGYDFMIAPASAISAGDAATLYGANVAEDGLSGKLVVGAPAAHISLVGDVLITINMENDAYTVNYAFETLYPFSGTTSVANTMQLYTTNYISYSGVAALSAQWRLGAQPDKNNGTFFCAGEGEPKADPENPLSVSGTLANGRDPQLTTPLTTKTLYWIDVNLVQMTYNISALQTLSVIGNGNDWSHETSIDMKANSNLNVWTATDINIDGDFKIAANKAWAISFSGRQVSEDSGAIVYNVNKQDGGDNLFAPTGKYDVKLDFSVQPYVLTLTKK